MRTISTVKCHEFSLWIRVTGCHFLQPQKLFEWILLCLKTIKMIDLDSYPNPMVSIVVQYDSSMLLLQNYILRLNLMRKESSANYHRIHCRPKNAGLVVKKFEPTIAHHKECYNLAGALPGCRII